MASGLRTVVKVQEAHLKCVIEAAVICHPLFYEEGLMSLLSTVDVAGRRRSPATTAEFHLGRAPGNKGMSYPADPPRVEEIVA